MKRTVAHRPLQRSPARRQATSTQKRTGARKIVRVLVAGDVVTDQYLYEGKRQRPGSPVLEGSTCISDFGGAALVSRLLQTLAAHTGIGPTPTPHFLVDRGFAAATQGRDAFCVMKLCAPWVGEKKPQVWRIAHALGYSAGEPDVDPQNIRATALDNHADVVVLDDAGLGFRRRPAAHAWPKFLRERVRERELPQWVVLKVSGPLGAGDLWHTIVSGHTQPEGRSGGPRPQHLGPIAGRTVVLLSIDELRREFARVDGGLTWERAAADLIQELDTNPRLRSLQKVGFIVVRFGLDGALVIDQSRRTVRHTLVFDPAGVEGEFLSRVPSGILVGYQSCLTAAVASSLAGAIATAESSSTPSDCLIGSVKAALSAMRCLARAGHGNGPDLPAGFPYTLVTNEIANSTPSWSFGSAALPSGLKRNTGWSIVAGAGARVPVPLWGLARRVARHGIGQLAGIPYLQFARLLSVDRSEIESFRTLQRLLTSYRQDKQATKPLSIAAFGPPGSGKSFGIKQLAEALFDDRNPLEFNLAQFSTPGELHGLFHQVRDRVLKGDVPIVFWDEFDSRDLFWLQYLLAPMQDGTFQDGQVTHPIGRCVFVFAGGTRDRFEDFGSPPATESGREKQKSRDEFTMKKGPDFKSRLAGYINVLGPNQRDRDDITFPVRRALLLRVHLGLKPDAPAAIDDGLLNAFLRISEYRHGARSLEKIVEQVRQSARAGAFNRSDLPPRQLIHLHVDADEFLSLLENP